MAGNKILLDTNAIIALQRQNQAVIAVIEQATDVFIPIITVGELMFGAYKSQRATENRNAVRDFIAGRVILYIDVATTDMYGLIKNDLRRKGRPIPENDLWIASLALQHGLVLITDDSHFDAIDSLSTKHW